MGGIPGGKRRGGSGYVLVAAGETWYTKGNICWGEVNMIKTQELFDDATSLPVEIRAQLIDKLLRSIHPIDKEIDQLWAVEAERRVEEIRSGEVETIPGSEVLKKIVGR